MLLNFYFNYFHTIIPSHRELSFKKGDIIYIRRQIDKNWYEGEHNAMIGLLPVQYVDVRTILLHNGIKF